MLRRALDEALTRACETAGVSEQPVLAGDELFVWNRACWAPTSAGVDPATLRTGDRDLMHVIRWDGYWCNGGSPHVADM